MFDVEALQVIQLVFNFFLFWNKEKQCVFPNNNFKVIGNITNYKKFYVLYIHTLPREIVWVYKKWKCKMN